MSSFEFATAGRVVVGRGSLVEVGPAARSLGRHALVVTGRSGRGGEALAASLRHAGVGSTFLAVEGEPTVEMVMSGVRRAVEAGTDHVIGLGGGSAIDAAKAIAALAANPGDPFDYLETIGRGQPLARAAWPVIAIPTTAGTGSEVTRNAVLASPPHRVKVSVRSATMLPRVAIVDPELAVGLPPLLTANTGLDALTQLIEPYVSSRANPMVDALSVEGIRRVSRALPAAFRDGANLDARQDMALASLWSGMALANAGLGAVHGLAGPIGGLFGAPHGAICAALLPHVMTVNLAALRRAGHSDATERYTHIAQLVTGRSDASADDGVRWVGHLVADLGVPGLGAYGVTMDHVGDVIEPARRASSMKANRVVLSPEELAEILQRSI